MKLMLDQYSFSQKPQGYEIGCINKRIINNLVDINVEQLAEELGSGRTITPATFKSVDGQLNRRKENWESQQVFALDFDKGLTLDEAYRDEFFQQNAAFLYTTFSHTKEQHKFRVVFVLNEPITDYEHFEQIMGNLLERYPYADQSCKDGSRIFFGGTKVTPFNYENRLSIDNLLFKMPSQDIKNNLIYMSASMVHTNNKKSINNIEAQNIEMIKERDVGKLQEIMSIEPITLAPNEVFDYLKRQDLRKLLGIETTGNFIDIFHEERNPSASIYKSHKGNGHWLYKCHSESSPFTGTILHVIQKLLNCSIVEVKAFLVSLYKIKVFESEKVKQFKESIDIYKEMIKSEELEEIHPNFYQLFNRYGYLKDLYILLDLAKDFVTDDSNPRIVFYHSIRTLAKQFDRSPSVTGTRINFFTYFNLINKLTENETPKDLLRIQKKNQRNKSYRYKSNTYELPIYTYDLFCEIDEMCKVWIEKGCTGKTVSYEGILRNFSREEADRVFPQDEGKEIGELNEAVVSQIHLNVFKFIKYKGWTTEKEVLENLTYYFKGQYEFKTCQFKRCIGELLDAYNLEIIPLNKKLKTEMGINEEYMSKFSFPKIIRQKKDPVEDGNPLQGK